MEKRRKMDSYSHENKALVFPTSRPEPRCHNRGGDVAREGGGRRARGEGKRDSEYLTTEDAREANDDQFPPLRPRPCGGAGEADDGDDHTDEETIRRTEL